MRSLRFVVGWISFVLAVVVGACGVSPGSVEPATDAGSQSDGSLVEADVPPLVATFRIGGSVSGLVGTGLVLQNHRSDEISVTANGPFAFPIELADGSPFSVTIKSQPTSPSQTCSIVGGTGTVVGGDVTHLAVECSTTEFAVGGLVTGLAGAGLVLQNNGGFDLDVKVNGAFEFSAPVASGAPYLVTVKRAPENPAQTCTVGSGAGTVGAVHVSDVTVTCTTNHYPVGGKVSGLSGGGLVLQNGGKDDLSIPVSGAFVFGAKLASGSVYDVTVKTDPTAPSQQCTVTAGKGTVVASAVSDVTVSCTTRSYVVGGMVTGLVGTGLVLRNNDGDDLPITADGLFTFMIKVPSGGKFDVSVLSQPTHPEQTCTVLSGAGSVDASDISSVVVTCVDGI